MDVLDKTPGIIGYAVVRADDGSVVEVKGSSASALADLTAYFASAGEAIRNNLDIGMLGYITLVYGGNRLVIVPREDKFIGIETEREHDLELLLNRLNEPVAAARAAIEVPGALASKIQQISLLIDEFSEDADRQHWLDLVEHSLGLLGREATAYIGVIDGRLAFKASPAPGKEDDVTQVLRYIVDFLVKKAVEEMGSSQARAKVHKVIERMK
ncbi:roadblock/LC7 domain-containing protein [candidate division WOR-3 bacterium]|nr:roadblock/LC7 domain-containing protein [candidate division WOR-3 bacterium]